MKYPPVLQVIIAAAIAWGLARNIPLFGIGGSFTTFIIWGSAVLGFGLLAYALKLFRFHKTTFDPLEPTKAKNLVVSGIYNYTRNPMYLGLALLLKAWCLYLGDVIAFVSLPLFVIAMNTLQIKAEERALLENFGDKYLAYKRRVRRWI
ncbi:MAG: methyltransferase family protein [Planktomarina sp.]